MDHTHQKVQTEGHAVRSSPTLQRDQGIESEVLFWVCGSVLTYLITNSEPHPWIHMKIPESLEPRLKTKAQMHQSRQAN